MAETLLLGPGKQSISVPEIVMLNNISAELYHQEGTKSQEWWHRPF